MSTNLNLLPSPTWNHLGVNEASAQFALPDVLPDGAWVGALPDGVSRLDPCPELFMDWDTGTGLACTAAMAHVPQLGLSVTGQAAAPLVLTQTGGAMLSVDMAPGSALTAVLLLDGDAPAANMVQIQVGAGAKLKLTTLRLSGSAPHWSGIALGLGEDAAAQLLRVELGQGQVLAGSKTVLLGDRASLTLDTLYFGGAGGALDFNDTATHLGRDTHSQQTCTGVLAKGGDKLYRGTVDLRRGAVRAVGHESEDVLLLDPDVKNRTVPLILCGEENVEGQHAATIGRLDEEALFYLMSRGLTKEDARKALIKARFAVPLALLPEELQQSVTDALERRLSHAGRAR